MQDGGHLDQIIILSQVLRAQGEIICNDILYDKMAHLLM